MSYLATINTPGYLPWDDEPPVFETAAEAWEYLAEERKRAEDEFPEWSDHGCPDPVACGYSGTYRDLLDAAAEQATGFPGGNGAPCGTIYGDTPGCESDHDLGLAYSVTWTDEEVAE